MIKKRSDSQKTLLTMLSYLEEKDSQNSQKIDVNNKKFGLKYEWRLLSKMASDVEATYSFQFAFEGITEPVYCTLVRSKYMRNKQQMYHIILEELFCEDSANNPMYGFFTESELYDRYKLKIPA